jgi:probable rRNA maturation factor
MEQTDTPAEPTRSPRGERPALDLVDATGRLAPEPLRRLRALAAAALDHLGCAGEARIRIVADAEMARLHEQYTGVPGTTDVLTFDLSDPATPPTPHPHTPHPQHPPQGGPGPGTLPLSPTGGAGGALDADIILCLDEAQRAAARLGHEPERELLLYLIHGLLHCLGHDDHDEPAARRMHETEDRILTAIGVGPTYSAPGGGPNP